MYHSQFGGATKCSLGIYPPPRPSPAGGEGDEGAPPREGEGDEGAPPPDGEGDEGAPPPDGEGEAVVSPRRRNAIRPATPAKMAGTGGVKEPGMVLWGGGHAAPGVWA